MNIDNIIKETDIKITPARVEILDLLTKSKKPVCYEEIRNELSMDKATFYRNISKFEDSKVVNSFESNDKKRYYEISKFPHAHFICTNCNNIKCIKQDLKVELKDYKIEDVILKGLCPTCNNQ